MGDYEAQKIADAFKECSYAKGDMIIKEGDRATNLYFILNGDAVSTKGFSPGEDIRKFKKGDHIGELALMRDQPYTASVIVLSNECKCVSIDYKSFTNLVGPLNDLMI